MKLKHASSYYRTNPYYECEAWYATHYHRTIASGQILANMKAVNPDLIAYYYHSIMDNYSAGPEGLEYTAIAQELGINPEAVYLHYAEETEVGVWADERIVYPAGSRVEVFHGGHQNAGLREACSFLPAVRPVHVEFIRRLPSRSDWNHDGIMLDNSGPAFWNWGTTLYRGGTVAEAGVKVNQLSPWHWENLHPTLVYIRQAIAPLPLGGNIANAWNDNLLTDPWPLDDVGMESVGNPIRQTWPTPLVMWDRHRRAADLGIRLWSLANPELGTLPDAVSQEEMLHGVLSYALMVGSRTSHFHTQVWTGPLVPDWPSWIYPHAIGHYTELLGEPTGQQPYIWIQSVTPLGTPYKVWARHFKGGVALVRTRDPWNGPILDDAVIHRPSQMALLNPDGTLSTPDDILLHNGGGAILIRV